MGHLARAAAIALACENVEPVVFSLSRALPLVAGAGLRCEYCPGRTRTKMHEWAWQHYLAARIRALVLETGAQAFVFDGAWPYAGLEIARAQLPGVAFSWVRRGMWQPGVNRGALRQQRMFDQVIEPGELASAADRGATAARGDAVPVAPITLLQQVDRLTREDAARSLGLDPARPTMLITLRSTPSSVRDHGATELDAARTAVQSVLAEPGWQVAVTSSAVSPTESGMGNERVITLRGVFPLARFLAAFDAAVVEAGYNSFHEVLQVGMPAVVVPTRAAVTDDQTARAHWAEREGFALYAPENEPGRVAALTRELLRPEVREKLAARCMALPMSRGAAEAAQVLSALAESFSGHGFTFSERIRTARLHLRPLAARVAATLPDSFGPGSSRGRPAQSPNSLERPELTEDLAEIETTCEHVLPGSSASYRASRERLVARYYGG